MKPYFFSKGLVQTLKLGTWGLLCRCCHWIWREEVDVSWISLTSFFGPFFITANAPTTTWTISVFICHVLVISTSRCLCLNNFSETLVEVFLPEDIIIIIITIIIIIIITILMTGDLGTLYWHYWAFLGLIIPVTENVIERELFKLNPNKSCGFDDLQLKVIQRVVHLLKYQLKIINYC